MTRPLEAVFRCDASRDIGAGHVMRCMVLAEILRQNGFSCAFSCIPETLEILPSLPKKFTVLPPGKAYNADLLILDLYGLSVAEEEQYRKQARKMLVIDDLCDLERSCDMLLCNNLAFGAGDYAGKTPENSVIFVDPGYLLLRPEFTQEFSEFRVRPVPARKIILFFGMTDPANLMLRVLRVIRDQKIKIPHIDAVVGTGHPALLEIESLAVQTGAKLHVQVDYMKRLMEEADLAVGCGGTAIWERLTTGLPALEISHSQWQVNTLRRLDAARHLRYLGDYRDIGDRDLVKAIEDAVLNGFDFEPVRCGHRLGDLARTIKGALI